MRFRRTTPILRIVDESKAREFYVEFLGFNTPKLLVIDPMAAFHLTVLLWTPRFDVPMFNAGLQRRA